MLLSIAELVKEIRPTIRCITAEQAMQELAAGNGMLLDIREAAEVDARPAPRSIPIPRGILEMKLMELVKEPDAPLYLHCATGGRATLAAEQLQRLGYTKVTVITCPLETVLLHQENPADQQDKP